MTTIMEKEIVLLEVALDDAMDEYFNARPHIERNRQKEKIFSAGFRKAFEFLNAQKKQDVNK